MLPLLTLGGILLYVRDDIPSKTIENLDFGSQTEAIFVEIKIGKVEWLISCSYNLHKANIKSNLQELGKNLDLQSSKYDNFILLGDFNAEPSEKTMNDFLDIYNLENLVKHPTCSKNPDRPSYIDFILTNKTKSFQPSILVETGISDFHKIVVTVLKQYFKKKEPTVIKSRKHKNFCNDRYRSQLLNEQTTNRNKFITNPSEENNLNYKKQRNFCVTLLRNEKKYFFESTDTKKITDNKTSWKTANPFISNKCRFSENITLGKGDDTITDNAKVADIFNDFSRMWLKT